MAATTTAPPSASRLMTANEFWDFVHLPQNEHKILELRRGEVIELPSPTKPHGRVCLNIGFALETYARKSRNGYALSNDSGVILERDPDTVRGPDVAYYLDVDLFKEMEPKWSEAPPLLAVEVQSPGDRQVRIAKKIAEYLDNGVRVVWVVNYEERFATVHRVGRSPRVFECGQELTVEELPGFTCTVDDFFKLPKEFAQNPPTS